MEKTIRSNYSVKTITGRFFPFLTILLFAFAVQVRADSTVLLDDSLRQLGLRESALRKGDPAKSERFTGNGVPDIYAEKNVPYLEIGGIKVFLSRSVDVYRDNLTITGTDYQKVLVPLLWRSNALPKGVRRIVIDPGHGGKDVGKICNRTEYTEKSATLDTAFRLKNLLEKRGFEIILTRKEDVFVDLDDRAAMANRVKADLFISVHYNSSRPGDTTSSGIETYCLTPTGQLSTNKAKAKADVTAEPGNRMDYFNVQLAWSVQRQLINNTGAEDRGVRRARFAVLRPLNCPGILIEGGFMSSKEEGAKIANPAYRQKLAEAIAAGITDYNQRFRVGP